MALFLMTVIVNRCLYTLGMLLAFFGYGFFWFQILQTASGDDFDTLVIPSFVVMVFLNFLNVYMHHSPFKVVKKRVERGAQCSIDHQFLILVLARIYFFNWRHCRPRPRTFASQ